MHRPLAPRRASVARLGRAPRLARLDRAFSAPARPRARATTSAAARRRAPNDALADGAGASTTREDARDAREAETTARVGARDAAGRAARDAGRRGDERRRTTTTRRRRRR